MKAAKTIHLTRKSSFSGVRNPGSRRVGKQGFFDFIRKLKEEPANFKIKAGQAKSVRGFLRSGCANVKTKEIRNSDTLQPMIDFDKVRNFAESMGYCQIVSSKLEMNPLKIIESYHGFR